MCFANNKGGAGKTFMAYQLACEAARAKPNSKVLVIDFSIYSDISALLCGGSSRERFGASMRGLQNAVDGIDGDQRADALVRDLELEVTRKKYRKEAEELGNGLGKIGVTNAQQQRVQKSVFGAYFTPSPSKVEQLKKQEEEIVVDLSAYARKPKEFNDQIPENLYLIAGCGSESWSVEHTQDVCMAVDGTSNDIPLWARTGDDWYPAAIELAKAIENSEFETIFVDTDHLSACVLTKLALASVKSVVIPLSFDDVDFNRLFQDVTGNALLQDVMVDMDLKDQLKARVTKMVFTRVDKTSNKETVTPNGIHSPFTPTKTTQSQMDDMANQMWSACGSNEPIKQLFHGINELAPSGGSLTQTFIQRYFTTFKLVPDLAANISKMNGVPLCMMTGEVYTAPSGLSGKSDAGSLNALKVELQAEIQSILDESFNAPIINA
jgi:cellulose biosynthesis protein BcsQ